MTKMMAVVMSLLFAASFGVAQTRTSNRTEQEIRKINSEISEAGLRGDRATADRLIADDYIYTGMDGKTRTKAQIMQYMQPLPANVKYSSRIEDVVIRDFGGTAVMSYRMVEDVEENGQKNHTQYRSTDVFMRRKGRWQLIATHTSMIPESAR